jgi:hypothetical protein
MLGHSVCRIFKTGHDAILTSCLTSENNCIHIGNEIYLFKQLTLSRDISNDVVVAIPQSCFENSMNRIP